MFYKKHYKNKDGECCALFKLPNGREVEITDKDARKLVQLILAQDLWVPRITRGMFYHIIDKDK